MHGCSGLVWKIDFSGKTCSQMHFDDLFWGGVILSSAGLGWAELHQWPEARCTDLGWAGLIVIVIVGWAGLGRAELHPRPEAINTELGWAGLGYRYRYRYRYCYRYRWAGLSGTHGERRCSPDWVGLGLSLSLLRYRYFGLGWAEQG